MSDRIEDIIDVEAFEEAPSDLSTESKVEWVIGQLTNQEFLHHPEVEEARARREKAVAIREQTELGIVNEAKSFYQNMRDEAQRMLSEAESMYADAERIKAEAERYADSMLAEAKDKAEKIVENADTKSKRDRIVAIKEIKATLARAEAMKVAAQEELENQKILTNALEMKFSPSNWVASQHALEHPKSSGAEYAGAQSNSTQVIDSHQTPSNKANKAKASS